MILSAVLFAAVLKIVAAGDAFMVQGFPKDYAVDAQASCDIAVTLARLCAPFGTLVEQSADGVITVAAGK